MIHHAVQQGMIRVRSHKRIFYIYTVFLQFYSLSYHMVVSGISCPETILNKKRSRGDMSVRISHISKID